LLGRLEKDRIASSAVLSAASPQLAASTPGTGVVAPAALEESVIKASRRFVISLPIGVRTM
jgi:hypothetical protein